MSFHVTLTDHEKSRVVLVSCCSHGDVLAKPSGWQMRETHLLLNSSTLEEDLMPLRCEKPSASSLIAFVHPVVQTILLQIVPQLVREAR